MNTWTPLWNGIIESSLWDETDLVVKVFLTMMARKDADHIYRGSAYALGQQSRKSEMEVLDALKILAAPDTKRIEPQPHEGRRIKAVEEGWLILNGQAYREKVSVEMKRARNRRAQAAHRERLKHRKPLPGEEAYLAAERNGASAEQLAQMAEPKIDRSDPL